MTTNDNLSGLKPCPFCGAVPELKKAGRDWYRIEHPHVTECLLDGITFDYPQTDEDLADGMRDWNRRAALAEPDIGEVVTEEMALAGMEASLLGRPSVDDESYAVSIYKAMREAALNKAPAKAEPVVNQQFTTERKCACCGEPATKISIDCCDECYADFKAWLKKEASTDE